MAKIRPFTRVFAPGFRSALKSFTVYVKRGDPQGYEYPEFIEEGFNWKAFLLAPFWALYHRLWLLGGGLLIFNAILTRATQMSGVDITVTAVVQLAVFAIVGFCADELRRRDLERRGYLLSDIVVGETLAQAQLRFFERYFSRNPAP